MGVAPVPSLAVAMVSVISQNYKANNMNGFLSNVQHTKLKSSLL